MPNREDGEGESFLDVVWARAPFATRGDFVRHVRRLAAAWQAAGVYTEAERQRMVAAAARAELRE